VSTEARRLCRFSPSAPGPATPRRAVAWFAPIGLLMGLAAVSPTVSAAADAPSLTHLRCEYKVDPLGIDSPSPRLSWTLESDARGVVQAAYRIQVAPDEAKWNGPAVVWDTGKVASDRSVHVPYEGPALESGRRYHWRVRVWDGDDRASRWSAPAYWEMGLLRPEEWTAAWITPVGEEDTSRPQPAPMLRGTFSVDGAVKSARAYVTALGLYELQINGQRVGDQVFTPGWTSYRHRLQYQTYDVLRYLRRGENAVGATLGDGWYRGHLGWGDRRNIYGDRLGLLCQIRITYANGREEVVGTDETWKSATGPIRHSDIYMGEAYDARLERPGWSAPGYDDSDWASVRTLDHSKQILIAPAEPPVRKIQELHLVEILKTPAGETVVDMGQNMVGWVRLAVEGSAGTTVTLRHAEVLDKDGNLYTDNLRAATQKVTYVLKGVGREVFEPHFTFQGFRYVAVDGWPGELTPESLTGVVIHSDMPVTGHFETSNPLLDQLQHNIRWGQKGNFLDVPTDCPQRDERLGWTGDAQVFARTAAFNMEVAGFFTKWLGDLAADQNDAGSVPHVVPDVLSQGERFSGGSAAWADAAVIIPWTMYLSYGDTRLLEEQYESMKAWVEYMRRQAGESAVWNSGFHFGDWLAFASNASDYPGATTGKDLIATAFFAHSTDLLQRTAEVLGREDDATEYAALLSKIKKAFEREFVTRAGRVGENTQTAYALALQFDLLPEDLRAEAARRLAADVRSRGHLTTGFVGAPYLCPVLSRYGYLDIAYMLLNRKEYPSWLYPVTQGATTIWERWDGLKPDGTFQDAGMNSFNHYAYGAIGEWMYRVVAGLEIDPAEPGYRHVLVQPQPGGGLTSASAREETLYGEAGSAWALVEGNRLQVTATVPPNTWGTVRLPNAVLTQVTEDGRLVESAPGVRGATQEDDGVVVEVGSGQYRFTYRAGDLVDRLRPAPFHVDQTVAVLLESPAAVAVIEKHMPGLTSDPLISESGRMSLRQVAEDAGLSEEALQALDDELRQIRE
jgi:alpha-L-rhamnosidase